jgi:hypothetical protein
VSEAFPAEADDLNAATTIKYYSEDMLISLGDENIGRPSI